MHFTFSFIAYILMVCSRMLTFYSLFTPLQNRLIFPIISTNWYAKSLFCANLLRPNMSIRYLSLSSGKMYNGLVIERYGDKLVVEYCLDDIDNTQRQIAICSQRQSLANSPVVVGDLVNFQLNCQSGMKPDGSGLVYCFYGRRNILERPGHDSSIHKLRMKPIASNIDQLVIVTSDKPNVPLISIDQFIVAAISFGINTENIVILVNKCDGSNLDSSSNFYGKLEPYRKLGHNVLRVSAESGLGIGALRSLLSSKSNIFVGQSGVGKSSLVNRLLTGYGEAGRQSNVELAKVGNLKERTGFGAHTTSNARLYHLPSNASSNVNIYESGCIIDSPGIREFALWNHCPSVILSGFVEIAFHSRNCRFKDCSHRSCYDIVSATPGCAVVAAVQEGQICRHRYKNFVKIMDSVLN